MLSITNNSILEVAPEYEATARGYKCRLYILCPTAESSPDWPASVANHWEWLAKEDGAGFEEMGSYNKSTQEWEADVDNDEKSGYTNALRRAAQDAWGIGRYLYDKGIPGFLDPNNMPLKKYAEPAVVKPTQEQHKDRTAGETYPSLANNTGATAEDGAVAKLATQLNKAASTPKAAKISLPRNGKSVFTWAKLMENTFGEKLMLIMAAQAKSLGYPSTVGDWNESQTKVVSLFAAGHCTKSANYRGPFDQLASEIADSEAAAPSAPPKTTGINVADLRKELVNKMKALIAKQTGRDSTSEELKSLCEEIAPLCQTAQGHTGEIPESLNHLADATWISNMIRFVNDQIVHAMSNQVAPEADDTPF